jgi:hypothetical protein
VILWNRLVSTQPGLEAVKLRNRVRFPAGKRDFPFLQGAQIVSEAHLFSNLMGKRKVNLSL